MPQPKAKIPKAKKRISEQTARARKELALAEKHELQVRQIKGELVEAKQVIELWAANAALIASAIGNLPEIAAPDVALCGGDARKIRAALRSHVERLQVNLAVQLSGGLGPSAEGAGLRASASGEDGTLAVGGAAVPAVQ